MMLKNFQKFGRNTKNTFLSHAKTLSVFCFLFNVASFNSVQAQYNEYAPYNQYEGQSYCEPQCGDRSNFYIRGEYLYWKPQLTALELAFGTASVVENDDTDIPTSTLTEADVEAHFKWSSGFRVGAGYRFNDSDWEMDAMYTYFKGSGTRSRTQNPTTINSGRASTKLSQLDVLLSYNVASNCAFSYKPFIGVRGANIRQSLVGSITTDYTFLNGVGTELRTFDDAQKYKGIGPIAGLQGNYDLGSGFSLYGSGAAGLLYGRYKTFASDTDTFSFPTPTRVISNHNKRPRSFDVCLDLAVGLRWETQICDSYELGLQVGFEHHQFFNQSRMGIHRGDLTFDGGVFSADIGF